jgi:hypothetical protein
MTMDASTIRTLAITAAAVVVGLWLVKKLGDKTSALINSATKGVGTATAAAAG